MTVETFQAELREQLRRVRTAPFLFVGSGLSRRYLGLDDWEGVLRRFAGYTGEPYDFYRASAGRDMAEIGSLIAQEFHRVWWKDPQFERSRLEAGREAHDRAFALKYEVARYVSERSHAVTADPDLVAEMDALKRAELDGIITTNWDTLLEGLFEDFRTYVGQAAVLFSSLHGIGEIYKIHGSCDTPASMVLTAEDYRAFGERSKYLAAKLLTIFVEHPVIVLGYSINDANVRSILSDVAACSDATNMEKLRDRLIIVNWDQGVAVPRLYATTLPFDRGVVPVTRIDTGSFLPIFSVLQETRREFSAPLLRKMRESVYSLVAEEKPSERIYVMDIDDTTNFDKVDFVLGVGAREIIASVADVGYRTISRDALVRDIVFDDLKGILGRRYDPERLLREVIPAQYGQLGYWPIHKYLAEAGRLDPGGTVDLAGLDPKYRPHIGRTASELRFSASAARQRNLSELGWGIPQILGQGQPADLHVMARDIALLDWQAIDLAALHAFLRANYDQLWTEVRGPTNVYKLICLFDFLRHCPTRSCVIRD